MDNYILPNEPLGATVIPQRSPYIVYIKYNDSGYITAVNSSVFLEDTAGWVEIDRGYGNKYGHAQTGYFPEPIRTRGGAYHYKLVDGKAEECTEEEIAEQEMAIKSSYQPPQTPYVTWEDLDKAYYEGVESL